MATVTIDVAGENRLIKKLGDLDDALKKRFFAEAAEYVIPRIILRTQSGKDADGKAFKPYSPKYKLFRQSEGRSGTTVDLTFHGDMMNAMTYRADHRGAVLFFANTSDRSGAKNPAKAFFLQQDRKFFALSAEDIAGVRRIAELFVRRALDG